MYNVETVTQFFFLVLKVRFHYYFLLISIYLFLLLPRKLILKRKKTPQKLPYVKGNKEDCWNFYFKKLGGGVIITTFTHVQMFIMFINLRL